MNMDARTFKANAAELTDEIRAHGLDFATRPKGFSWLTR
jgi:hypothetical protein